MNNQFATQFLREEQDEVNTSIKSVLTQTGADKDLVDFIMNAISQGALTPERAIQIIRDTFREMNEDGAAAPAGGSTTGGGVTNGATFTPGNGEQYAAGTRKKKYQEDAPRLAGEPSRTNKQGAKNLSAYSSAGFTKAPSAEAAAKQIKGVEVKELWEGSVPDNIAKFAKRKGISSTVSKIAGWAEKAGKKITGGTAIGKNYDTLILDLGYQDSAIRIEIPERIITVYDQPVRDFNSFEAALRQEGEELNESKAYSRFKKQTALRSKSDQMHEAAKMIYNRLAEITKILEYTSQMKTEILEGEDGVHYKHNTKKVFEKINLQVIEVYSKVKGLK